MTFCDSRCRRLELFELGHVAGLGLGADLRRQRLEPLGVSGQEDAAPSARRGAGRSRHRSPTSRRLRPRRECPQGLQVDLDRVADRVGVAAGERQADGDAGRGEAVAHERVAGGEAVLREREAAELVPSERVGAGEVEADVRP